LWAGLLSALFSPHFPFIVAFVLAINIHETGEKMTQIAIGQNESIESALRRFKREVSKAGIFSDMKKHRHFETPLQKHKRKAKEAAKSKRYRKHSR
jgi:small subunit ribosomal protein S21